MSKEEGADPGGYDPEPGLYDVGDREVRIPYKEIPANFREVVETSWERARARSARAVDDFDMGPELSKVGDPRVEGTSDVVDFLRNPRDRYSDIAHKLVSQLAAYRQGMGLTQTDVAKRLGVNTYEVARIEDRRKEPTLAMILEYADAVGLRIVFDVVENLETKLF